MVESKRIISNQLIRNVAKDSFCCQHVCMDKQTAEYSAKQIAHDLEGPIGPVPLERVLIRHIGFLDEIRKSGATWPQIAALLNNAGATRKDGSPIPADQLRAIASRISKIKVPTEISSTKTIIQNEKPTVQLPHSKPNQVVSDNISLRQKIKRALNARRTD